MELDCHFEGTMPACLIKFHRIGVGIVIVCGIIEHELAFESWGFTWNARVPDERGHDTQGLEEIPRWHSRVEGNDTGAAFARAGADDGDRHV